MKSLPRELALCCIALLLISFPAVNAEVLSVEEEIILNQDRFIELKILGSNDNHLIFSYNVIRSDILEVKISNPALKAEELDKDLFKTDYSEHLDSHGFLLEYETQPFSFSIIRRETNEPIFSTKDSEIVIKKRLVEISTRRTSQNIFGLGERNTPRFNLDSGKYTIWNFDQSVQSERQNGGTNTYGSHPVYLQREDSKKYHMLLFKNSHAMDVDISDKNIKFKAIGGVIDFVILLGNKHADSVVKAYHEYIGGHTLPPFWSFGFHQSRYGWKNIYEVERAINGYKDSAIPLEVIWSDIDIYPTDRNFDVDERNYPRNRLSSIFKEAGLKYVAIVDPAITLNDYLEAFRLGKEMDVYLRSPSTGKYLVGKLWTGLAVFPDWTHSKASAYWSEILHKFRQKIPFDGLWLDMNEPSSFCDGECYYPNLEWVSKSDYISPKETLEFHPGSREPERTTLAMEAKHANGKTEFSLHNLFGHYNCKLSYEYLKEKGSSLPFILSRSTFVGSGKYTAHWSGDNDSSFSSMRISVVSMLNFNLFGIPMTGSDICGFFSDAWDNLCARWIQLGSLYPFSRNHNFFQSRSQELYDMGKIVKEAAKNSLAVRYAILKHYYALFVETRGAGAVVKPLFFEFPDDENVYGDEIINKQFLIGKSLMALPILDDITRSALGYFPAGKWYDLLSENFVAGFSSGQSLLVKSEFTDGPVLYLREGALLGVQDSSQATRLNQLGNAFILKGVLEPISGYESENKTAYSARGFMLGIQDLEEENVKKKCVDGDNNCLIYIEIYLNFTTINSCNLSIEFRNKLPNKEQENIKLENFVIMNFPSNCKDRFVKDKCLMDIEDTSQEKPCSVSFTERAVSFGNINDVKMELKLFSLNTSKLKSITLLSI